MKIRLFEFEDLPWFPGFIRQGMTDYLGFILDKFNLYEPVVPVLMTAMDKCGTSSVVDLCSGGGGPVECISKTARSKYNRDVRFTLTDKFPNIPAFKTISERNNNIVFVDEPVDAADVDPALKGMRTIFSGFHHFDRAMATAVLQDAVKARDAVAIFDGGDKNILVILAILVGHPLVFFFCTPFFKPFRFSRILFTYLIPVIPLCTIWDGIISIMRLYNPSELLKVAREAAPDYEWNAGKVKNKYGMSIAWLTGIPQRK